MPPKFRHTKNVLDNGLSVVTVELPHLHTAALVFYARVGSRYESPEDNGLSHFLEHMLFRGTQRYQSSYALNYAIEELGGTLYAETGRDYSLYQISLDPELVPRGIALFGEIMGAPAFSQIELERQIILEEINEDLDEEGKDINLDDLARRVVFPGHALGQKITGPIDNVKRFSEDDVRRHFARFYGARNLLFCVSGPVDEDPVLGAAREAFARMPQGTLAQAEPPADFHAGPVFEYVGVPGSQTAVQLLFRALPESHPDYVALQALSRIMDDGMSTRLHYTLCDQKGLAYYVNGSIEPFHDAALFEIDGASAHAKFGPLMTEILALCDVFRREAVSDAELTKAKRRYRYDLATAFDDVDAMAGWYGGTELFYPAPQYDDKVARMEAVTAKDVLRAAEAVFQPERLVVAAAGSLSAKQRRDVDKSIKTWK